jgi:hypothetical protein
MYELIDMLIAKTRGDVGFNGNLYFDTCLSATTFKCVTSEHSRFNSSGTKPT